MTHLLLRSVSEKGASILVRDSDGGQMSAVSKYTSCSTLAGVDTLVMRPLDPEL